TGRTSPTSGRCSEAASLSRYRVLFSRSDFLRTVRRTCPELAISCSAFSEEEIEDPAAKSMLRRIATMIEDISIATADVLKSIGQDGEVGEAAVIVDAIGDADDVCGLPGGANSNLAERKWAENAAK